MHLSSPRAFRAAAVLGFLAVALGAFGAHGMEKAFKAQPDARDWWQTAALYHAVHAVVMLMLGCLRPFAKVSWWLFGVGMILFCGGLYLKAAGGPGWVVHFVPVGGVCFLVGWVWLAVRPPTMLAEKQGEIL